ncbi:interferon regulatory factor 7 isoform X5 [Cricetulus griseus]|uniref:Interferon regulatory factor 7 isoform X5 n=1 Tax=Cricetulus griseus TaxID=10029 RepID=A0A9J7JLX3_CRIGR|nr:interferon regulatory factor 7 isoform X5 [Cricetulus griseus]XP_027297473.1 interferon regulatory factor 7 isoform X5 [Cricetulus griseus]
MRAFGGWTTLTQSSVCPGSILVAGIWMKLMHVSSRPGLWPEEGGHLVEVTCHPQKLRLLSEQAGKPTSAVHSTAQGALSCIKTIQGTLLTPTRCIDLTRSLDALGVSLGPFSARGNAGLQTPSPLLSGDAGDLLLQVLQYSLLDNHLLGSDSVPSQDPGQEQEHASEDPHATWQVEAVPSPRLQHPALISERNLGYLDVTIMYKGRTVLQAMVGHPRCVFLYSPMSSAIRTSEPQPVIFPSPAELPDQKQLHYTETLLQHVSPGLQLEVQGLSLWALRMGKCKVYWEVGSPMGSTSSSTPAQLLERNCPTPIFNFSTFFQEVEEFQARRRQGSPHYTIYLGFGQDLSAGRPKEKSLILVKLEPWLCKAYLERVQREGVSSLDSSSLGLCLSSTNSLYDDIEHFLMELGQ